MVEYACNYCKKKYKSNEYLRVHINSKHKNNNPFSCDLCHKWFPREYDLNTHVKRVHIIKTIEKQFTCEYCHKKFRTKSSLSDHEIRRHGNHEKTFKCNLCSKTFYKKAELLSHVTTHSSYQTKLFQCNVCQKYFTTIGIRNAHIRNYHKPKEINLTCVFCERSFSLKGNLTHHILRHTEEKSYSCKICGKEFYTQRERATHLRSHTGEKCVQCLECGDRFTSNTGLRCHQTTKHGRLTQHQCIFCERIFPSRGTLWNHIISKIGEKPHMCDLCDILCLTKTGLVEHKRLHQNYKYCCNFCKKQFNSRYLMRKHKIVCMQKKMIAK